MLQVRVRRQRFVSLDDVRVRGRSQYGLWHFGQTFGGASGFFGNHSCVHRSHTKWTVVRVTTAIVRSNMLEKFN